MKKAMFVAVALVACGTRRNAPPAALSPRPVEPAFTAFLSPALHTTLSVSMSMNGTLGEGSETTTAFLRGPSNRVAYGVIQDGVVDGLVAHRMQFLLLPAEVVDAASDGDSLCALRTDKKIRCTGGRRGDGEKVDLDVDEDATRLFMLSRERRCALRKEGNWTCFVASFGRWERSDSLAKDLERFGPAREPVPGSRCFITRDGKLVCMDEDGLTGRVLASDVANASVGGGIGDFAAGCAVGVDGSVVCWGGTNETGTSGDGVRGPHADPWVVKGVKDAVAVARSTDHACALTRTHAVYCWGAADGWAFGEGALQTATKLRICDDGEAPAAGNCVTRSRFGSQHNHLQILPVRVPELEGVVSIAAGHERTCGVRTDGRVLCVGGGHPGPWTIDVGEK